MLPAQVAASHRVIPGIDESLGCERTQVHRYMYALHLCMFVCVHVRMIPLSLSLSLSVHMRAGIHFYMCELYVSIT